MRNEKLWEKRDRFFEVLSKSVIWLTAPTQGSPKKRSILANADWLRATANSRLKQNCRQTFNYHRVRAKSSINS